MWMVTGGAGYIGSHIVRALMDDGQQVVVVDDLSTGLMSRVPTQAHLEVFSILDAKQLFTVMKDLKVTGVVHLAAKKAAGESVNEPVYYHYENTGGMISLLRAMEVAEVKQLVYPRRLRSTANQSTTTR
jgi:UDP-glucose 4-epimerase